MSQEIKLENYKIITEWLQLFNNSNYFIYKIVKLRLVLLDKVVCIMLECKWLFMFNT